MKISVQPSALTDLKRGYRFYDRQQRGLGDYFIDSLYSDIDSLQLYAGIHMVHFGSFHRLLSDRFPYAVYYQIKDEVILIRAVVDMRSDPPKIAEKMQRMQ